MTVTAATFIVRFPEFGNIDNDVVTATVAEASRLCDSDVWDDQHDDAVNYLTAHLLALRSRAIGQQVGALPADGSSQNLLISTTYGGIFRSMRQALATTTGFAY